MKIGVEINGVLRNTLGKIQQEYQKWYIDNPFKEESEFEYQVKSDVTSLNISEHLAFKDNDELYNFLYKEHTMEIFGHAGSVEPNGLLDLNNLYLELRDEHEFIIVSDEIGKSKPASLFFISKFGSLIEHVLFYSEITIDNLWSNVDILVTANPKLLLNHPENKTLIKYETSYNSDTEIIHKIKSIKDLKNKLQEIC
jgi:hypothetical protein